MSVDKLAFSNEAENLLQSITLSASLLSIWNIIIINKVSTIQEIS